MKWAGIGWPNGPEPGEIWTMPGSAFLLLDSEARWHYDKLLEKRPEALVLWRSVAVPPLSVGLDVGRYCDAVLQHWQEQHHQTDLIPGNELNLNYERGDSKDDWDRMTMQEVYVSIGGEFLGEVREELRRRVGPNVRLHYPAWAPDHFMDDFSHRWGPEADEWDVIDFHAYGSLEQIQAEYQWFRQSFPGKLLCLTEWHGRDKDDHDEEFRILQWLATARRDDPLFMGACYFIWKWHQGRGQVDTWDIQDNTERLALFVNPPQAGTVQPPVEPPVQPPAYPAKPAVRDLREIRWRAHVAGLPYNEDAAFEQHWLAHPELGSPLTGELPMDDGRVGMVFANGERAWSAEKGLEVL